MSYIQSQSLKDNVARYAPTEDLVYISHIGVLDFSSINSDTVNAIENSIEEIGLINRITVVAVDSTNKKFRLLIGKHRHAAWVNKWNNAIKTNDPVELGRWQSIPVSVYTHTLPKKIEKRILTGESISNGILTPITKKTGWKVPLQKGIAEQFGLSPYMLSDIFMKYAQEENIILSWKKMSKDTFTVFLAILPQLLQAKEKQKAKGTTISRLNSIENYLHAKGDGTFIPG